MAITWVNGVAHDLAVPPSWKVDWSVSINGQDMTGRMRSYLIDIDVTDKEGLSSDACRLTFDNANGQVRMPTSKSAVVRITLMGLPVFTGVIDTVRANGSRGGGRLLTVTGKGFDTRGKAKQGQAFHMDDATLQEFLDKAGKEAGFKITVDPDLGKIKRDYWSIDGESLLATGQRLAREFNAIFKLRGTDGVLIPRGKADLPSIVGDCNRNVINWDIAPVTGRGVFGEARVSWFDRKEATFKTEQVTIEGGDAANVVRMPAADADQAKAIAEARKSESEWEGGEGSVELDLTPEAQAGAPYTHMAALDGTDGTYRIETVNHRANRASGATTRLDIKQPGGNAGKQD